jgi:hypothetical protein
MREKMIYRRERNQFSNFFKKSGMKTTDFPSSRSFNGEEMGAIGIFGSD